MFLIKTNAAGDTIWTRTFGGGGDDYGYSVLQTNDGGYMVAGNRSTGGFYLIKTNSDGDTLWTKSSYVGGLPHLHAAYSIQQTADNGYIVAGTSYGATGLDMFVIKTDVTGTTVWSKIYTGTNHDIALSIQQTADGGFIFLGTAAQEMYLVKMDANGNSGCNEGYAPVDVISVATISTPSTTISSGGTVTTPATIVKGGSIVNILCSNVGINEITTDNSISVSPNPFTKELKITSGEYGVSSIKMEKLFCMTSPGKKFSAKKFIKQKRPSTPKK